MSMLDDPGVLAGLEGLEPAEPRGSAAADPAFHESVRNLDSGLTEPPSTSDGDALTQFAPEPFEGDDGASDEKLDEDPVDWKTLLTSHSRVWVICGSVGAAAAAAVFHAEVSRLVWQWSGAVTALWP